jgi:hypothetical protein
VSNWKTHPLAGTHADQTGEVTHVFDRNGQTWVCVLGDPDANGLRRTFEYPASVFEFGGKVG